MACHPPDGTVEPNFLVQKEINEVSELHRMTKRMTEAKLASMKEETNSILGNKNQYFGVAVQTYQRRARQAHHAAVAESTALQRFSLQTKLWETHYLHETRFDARPAPGVSAVRI